jgi:hypothetical protein
MVMTNQSPYHTPLAQRPRHVGAHQQPTLVRIPSRHSTGSPRNSRATPTHAHTMHSIVYDYSFPSLVAFIESPTVTWRPCARMTLAAIAPVGHPKLTGKLALPLAFGLRV